MLNLYKQFEVTQNDKTEPPFKNEYYDNKEEGIYVDIVSGDLYVGFFVWPPVYPDTTFITPSYWSKGFTMHQKHPPANVANW